MGDVGAGMLDPVSRKKTSDTEIGVCILISKFALLCSLVSLSLLAYGLWPFAVCLICTVYLFYHI